MLGRIDAPRRASVINGIDWLLRYCIVLERNPAYRPQTKDDPFLNTWWILPENVKREAR